MQKNKGKNKFSQSKADFLKLMTVEEQHLENSLSSKIFKSKGLSEQPKQFTDQLVR